MSAVDSIAQLRKEAIEKVAEADRLTKLQAAYPDLRKHVGRWNKVTYCSKSVNASATDFDMRHNCGCCNDSPLEIWPYTTTEHGKVYSDPACFMVGERDPWNYGDRAYDGWDQGLRDAGIPEPLIERVSHLMKPADAAEEGSEADDGNG